MNNGFVDWLLNLKWQHTAAIVLALFVVRCLLLSHKSKVTKPLAFAAESLALYGGLFLLLIFPYYIQQFFIPSESMVPTFLVQDRIFANRAVYRVRDPQRGEIVIFDAPPEAIEMSSIQGIPEPTNVRFVKRVVGVPGDVLHVEQGYIDIGGQKIDHATLESAIAEARDKRVFRGSLKFKIDGVYINGEKLGQEELFGYLDKANISFDRDSPIQFYPGCLVRNGHRLDESFTAEDPKEEYPDPGNFRTWPSVQKAVQEKKLELTQQNGHLAVKIADGELFMMGDNRNWSLDSRFWGPLDRDRVMGRAMFIWFPFDRFSWAR